MKKIEVTVESDCLEELLGMLNKMNLFYTSQTIRFNGTTINLINILIPDEFVDEIIHQVSEKIDLRHKSNTLSILEVEGFVSTTWIDLKKKH